MFKPYTLDIGEFLVRLARKSVKDYLISGVEVEPPENTPKQLLSDSYGVFTTIEIHHGSVESRLRGCIGYPRGYQNVAKAVIKSAIAAAVEDPRFEPMKIDEISKVVFEVSILSPLEVLKVKNPKEYLEKIIIGRHGLVIQIGLFSGLLLPQVPVEYCWDVITFLNETCAKALQPVNCWISEETTVMTYEAQVFRELEPNGKVVERDLEVEYKEKCE